MTVRRTNRIAPRPLDMDAVAKADAELLANNSHLYNYEAGRVRRLTMDRGDYIYRQEWMDSYLKHAKENNRIRTNPNTAVQPCPNSIKEMQKERNYHDAQIRELQEVKKKLEQDRIDYGTEKNVSTFNKQVRRWADIIGKARGGEGTAGDRLISRQAKYNEQQVLKARLI